MITVKNLYFFLILIEKIEKFLCGWMATIMRMKRPSKCDDEMKRSSKDFYLSNSLSELNGFSSKSLLANALNINDDFGVIKKSKMKSKVLNNKLNNSYFQFPNIQPYLKRDNYENNQSVYEYSTEGALAASKNDFSSLRRNLNAILKEVRCMTQKLKENEEEEEHSLNWKFAAMVIDRLCMYFFTVATFISTALILFTSNNLYNSSDPHPKY